MPDPLGPVPIGDQIAAVAREVALRRDVYRKRVEAGGMTPEQARAELDAMRAVHRTLGALSAFDRSLTPVLSAMGYDVSDEDGESGVGPPAGTASAEGRAVPEPPPSDGLGGSEPVGPGQIGELQALLVEHGWDRETTLELLARSGWERLADVPVRKVGLVRSAIADPMHRARITEDLVQRGRRADGEGTSPRAA